MGVGYALLFPTAAALLVFGLLQLLSGVGPVVVGGLAGCVLWATSSFRLLLEKTAEVSNLSDSDIVAARQALPALVGRETTNLTPPEVRSAAIESLAENLSDGFIGPVLAFVLLSFVSFPAAAAGATFVKAVNTMDSMFGYPGALGWGSARLDDVIMFVPARLTAVLIALAARKPAAVIDSREAATVTPSPNAGWPMCVMAAALNVALKKPGVYVIHESGDAPRHTDTQKALAITERAGYAWYGAIALVGVLRWL